MREENSQHFLACLGKQLLRVATIGDRLALLSVPRIKTILVLFLQQLVIRTHWSLICRRFAFGMSRTKIHLTLKTPFHLSDAQTVLLRE